MSPMYCKPEKIATCLSYSILGGIVPIIISAYFIIIIRKNLSKGEENTESMIKN